jgi:glycosyltransferase involved in cell wall biosynthesis
MDMALGAGASEFLPAQARRCLLLSTCTTADVLRGAEKQAIVLGAGLRKRGWDVLMGVPPGSKVRQGAEEAGVPHFDLVVRPEYAPWVFWRLHRRARAFRPAILHLNDPHALSMGGYARLFGTAPLVIAHRRLAKTPHHVASYRIGTEGLICISEAVRRNMSEAGYPDDQMTTAYSCVDTRYLNACGSREEARARLSIDSGEFVFMIAAAIIRQKDHPTLLRAFVSFKGQPDTRLLVVGDGPDRAAVESLARELGIVGQVRFTGALEGAALLCAYRASDVFIHSTRREGLGVAALEAQAMGLPIIGTRVVGLTEAVAEGRTGLLVAYEDVDGLASAMARLRTDTELRERLGRAGPDWIRSRFSEDAMIDGVLRSYAEFWRRRARALP